jgi:hypothetical protein
MRILLAGILGGIAMFVWNFIGHDVLPLGHTGIHELPNEAAVLDALKTNMGENHGLYHFPGFGLGDNPTREQKQEAMKHVNEKLAANPSGILIYHPPGRQFAFVRALVVEFATDVLQSILVVFLLAQTSLVTITTNISYWNWYGFPKRYTAAYMFIELVGFICVGIVAALILRKNTSRTAP